MMQVRAFHYDIFEMHGDKEYEPLLKQSKKLKG